MKYKRTEIAIEVPKQRHLLNLINQSTIKPAVLNKYYITGIINNSEICDDNRLRQNGRLSLTTFSNLFSWTTVVFRFKFHLTVVVIHTLCIYRLRTQYDQIYERTRVTKGLIFHWAVMGRELKIRTGSHLGLSRKTSCDTIPQIARFIRPTWVPPGSCRPQMGPMLAPWTLLSGTLS